MGAWRSRRTRGIGLVMLHFTAVSIGFLVATDPATLDGFARLPGGTLRDGPPCGAALATDPRSGGRLPVPGQLVSGISGIVRLGDADYLALSDNGFGARDNSADYHLAVHRLRIDFEHGAVEVVESIPLRDPGRHAGFALVRDEDAARPLTGGDFDPESLQLAPDGTWWIGDEFGPFLLHFAANGEMLEAPIELPNHDGKPLRSPDHPALRDDPAAATKATVGSSAGIEALALASNGTRLLALLEKPLKHATTRDCLAFEFDLTTKRFSGDHPRHFALPERALSFTDAQFFGARRLIVLERDDTQGKFDGWKRIAEYTFDSDRGATRRELCNLLSISDPRRLHATDGSDRFAMPFLTIESLIVEDDSHLIVAVDDNFPLTRGRDPGGSIPDDTEFVRLALDSPIAPPRVRVATFNAALSRDEPGALRAALEAGNDEPAANIAAILQRVRPDIVLLNEFDAEPGQVESAIEAFRANYLAVSHGGAAPIEYPFAYAPPTNTGVASRVDLDRNGKIGGEGRDYGGDALGFGLYPGHYGMVLLSRFPLDVDAARTFGHLLWRDIPGAPLPDDPATPEKSDWYSAAALAVLPFSSKNHADVVARVGDRELHLLISHPTPPAFDGAEDRNGLRNAAEIRFWLDYLTPGQDEWIADRRGSRGGLAEGAPFVLLGDLNSDPFDGDSRHDVIRMLLAHRRVTDPAPRSAGAIASALAEADRVRSRLGDVAHHTADFAAPRPGDLRIDYALPSRDLEVFDAGVFWPHPTDPRARFAATSDHRLVFVDFFLR